MAEVVASNLVGKVADSLFAVVKKEIGYMWNSKENVEKLRSEAEKLKSMVGRVQQKINFATKKGDGLVDGVQKWVDEADARISMTEEFLKEATDAKKTCFNLRMCANLSSLHHYGKQAAKKILSLEQHQKDGVVYEGDISIPTPAPGILECCERKNLDELHTHKSVFEKIVKSVEDESKQIIGVFGMGGVGKTTLAKEVAATMKHQFADVVFVTVSQTVDPTKIEKKVENAAKRIMKGEKVLIILDDVWRRLELDKVGIPCGTAHPTCKILLTSRKRNVCESMNAQSMIPVDSLPIKEAWILFKGVVGERIENDAKLKPVAGKVVKGCGGLPLIIQVMGNVMKNEERITEWEIVLDKIEKHSTSDIDEDLKLAFANLRLSYDYLDSKEVQSCFLLCCMFPEDFKIPLECLARYVVGLRVFEDLKSLDDARNRVQDAVKILKSSCLLLDVKDESRTKMHDVVRDVALVISLKDNDNKFLAEAGKGLTKWQPRNDTMETYTGISLMKNDIRNLPTGYELKIPHLNIFLAQENKKLSTISDEFIIALKEAKVLDFENNNIISLPESLKQLTRLRMLNLGGNSSLCEISILGMLKNLEILILKRTRIKEIPQEIGQLVNLRQLDVQYCLHLSYIAPGVISKLRWLEELYVGYHPVEEGNHKSLGEIGELSNLTVLVLYVTHVNLIPQGDYLRRLKTYIIQVGGFEEYQDPVSEWNKGHKILVLERLHLDISDLMQVKTLTEITDYLDLSSIENLYDIMPKIYSVGFNNLKKIYVYMCPNVLCLVDSRGFDQIQTFHPSKSHDGEKNKRFLSEMEEIYLTELYSLSVIWNCPDQYISLNNLVEMQIYDCPKLERLFSVSVAQGLVSLKKLSIMFCMSLKEVISERDEETNKDEIDMVVPAINIVFPHLVKICLSEMENLRSFYPGNANIEYPSLVNVEINDCDKWEKWGCGTHHTPKLQHVNDIEASGSTIDDAVAKYRERWGF